MEKIIVFKNADCEDVTITPSWLKRRVQGIGVNFQAPLPAWQVEAYLKPIVTGEGSAQVTIDYAETEEEFLQRCAEKDMPDDASDIRFVEADEYDKELAAREEPKPVSNIQGAEAIASGD